MAYVQMAFLEIVTALRGRDLWQWDCTENYFYQFKILS